MPDPQQRSPTPLALLLSAFALFAAAAWLRLNGTGWDEFAGLHPDERHLLFIISDMLDGLKAVASDFTWYGLWFDTGHSPLDPHTGRRVYAYGETPVLTVALLAHWLGIRDWYEMMQLGRVVTALIDSFTVLAVYMLAFNVSGTLRGAVLAALLYASAPMAQQQANFYVVDSWVTAAFAWGALSLCALLQAPTFKQFLTAAICSGVFFGLAVACKLPGLAFGLPALGAIIAIARRKGMARAALCTGLLSLAALVAFRLANPFAFAGPGFFGLQLSSQFLADIASLQSVTFSEHFPPNWQWIAGYSWLNFLRDFVAFGGGPAIALALVLGARGIRGDARTWVLILSILPLFVFAMTSQTAFLRYALPTLPALCVLAAMLAVQLRPGISIGIAALGLWWGSGTYFLHQDENPRLAASRWIWTLPKSTVLAFETVWDDTLPVPVLLPGNTERRWGHHDDHFKFVDMEVIGLNSADKARVFAGKLAGVDYLVISSARTRAVMPRLPLRFPIETAYYAMLEDGSLCFQTVWKGRKGYHPLLFSITDDWVQEPWHVYDHPTVEIFQRQPCYDAKTVLAGLLK